MNIKDIMIKDVRHISPLTSAKEAFYRILDQRISGLPVIDENGNLVGMFTEKDVLIYIFPSYLNQLGKFIYTEIPSSAINKLAALDKIKVKDIMREKVITISEDASLAEAARLVLTHTARRLPVVSKGRVIGIIARVDILRALAKKAGLLKRTHE